MHRKMIFSQRLIFSALIVATLLAFRLPEAFAQQRGGVKMEFKGIDINYQKTPTYNDRSYAKGRNSSPMEWLQLVASYSTLTQSEKWIDRMTIRWHVLLLGGKTDRLYFTETVDYIDIQDGDIHYAVAYLHPRSIMRHFDDRRKVSQRNIVIYVEALVDNVRIADFTYNRSGTDVPNEWWRSPTLTKVGFGLLSRDKTPFAPLDYDIFETIVTNARN